MHACMRGAALYALSSSPCIAIRARTPLCTLPLGGRTFRCLREPAPKRLPARARLRSLRVRQQLESSSEDEYTPEQRRATQAVQAEFMNRRRDVLDAAR
mmetsp:Transcript_14741/g.46384  ORF Transcript_14741/g.46384 Transcript_14741/m.46384 type:complete len:99 (-) Transcript_14741:1356-1652(-)